jgi:hypothetical protein
MKNIFKKFFDRCKNSPENRDIYSEVRDFDMFSYNELKKKSAFELRAMLADDSLCALDDSSNLELIECICDVLEKKEKSPSFLRKIKSKMAWRRFAKQYITQGLEKPSDNMSDNPLIETEVKNKRKSHSFIKVFSGIAAAAIVILAVNLSQAPPVTLEEDILPMYSFKLEPENKAQDESWGVGIGGLPDNSVIKASGTITYGDNSKKQYTIYTAGEKMYFISVLTNTSTDINNPSENDIDPFDIFNDSGLDDTNIKDGGEVLRKFADSQYKDIKIVIYGDIGEVFDNMSVSFVISENENESDNVDNRTYINRIIK